MFKGIRLKDILVYLHNFNLKSQDWKVFFLFLNFVSNQITSFFLNRGNMIICERIPGNEKIYEGATIKAENLAGNAADHIEVNTQSQMLRTPQIQQLNFNCITNMCTN